jgi:hypothetical protein
VRKAAATGAYAGSLDDADDVQSEAMRRSGAHE